MQMEIFKYHIKMEAFVRLEQIHEQMIKLVKEFSETLDCAIPEYSSQTDCAILHKNHLIEDEYYVIGPEGYVPTIRAMTDRGVWIKFKKYPNAKKVCLICRKYPCQCDNYEHPEPPDNS